MARKVQVILEDDLDGSVLGEDGGTISFALDGTAYEIDLSKKNGDALRKALEKYVGAARKVGKVSAGGGVGRQARAASNSSARTGMDREQSTAIREWAKANGKEVSDRGRIPGAIVEEYNASHAAA